ncbi:uncharacterized protein [Clinocottus analis]|uniref:uncharacterized protein isoform X2 n=1 Tax=Clinocottus analis TaxID=304258 RepID=UPI0035BF3C05
MHPNTAMQPNTLQDAMQATCSRKPCCSLRAHTRPLTEYRERYVAPQRHTAMVLSSAQRNPNLTLKGTSAEMTTLRKPCCSLRAHARPSTEYRDRYVHPQSHTATIMSSAQRNTNPTLMGTSVEMTPLRSICATHKCPHQTANAVQFPESTKHHRRCSSITHLPARSEAEVACKVEDYTSVYKNDFQAWKVNKRLPYKQANSLTVNQGLVVTGARPSQGSPQVRKPQPFESITSYRSDYVTHPVQPIRRVKPMQSTKGLLSEPCRNSSKPRAAWEMNQDICDQASAFFQEFKNWSLKNKLCDRESGPAADDLGVHCTTCADIAELKCCCVTPCQPPVHTCQALINRSWSSNQDAQVME